MDRRLHLGEALLGLVGLGIASGAIAWALIAWLTDQELHAALLTGCGAVLVAWSAVRLDGAERE